MNQTRCQYMNKGLFITFEKGKWRKLRKSNQTSIKLAYEKAEKGIGVAPSTYIQKARRKALRYFAEQIRSILTGPGNTVMDERCEGIAACRQPWHLMKRLPLLPLEGRKNRSLRPLGNLYGLSGIARGIIGVEGGSFAINRLPPIEGHLTGCFRYYFFLLILNRTVPHLSSFKPNGNKDQTGQ